MECVSSESFEFLFQDVSLENAKEIFPLIQKCLSISIDEIEILRSVEICSSVGLQYFSMESLEKEIFAIACPAVKKLFFNKLQVLENNVSLNEHQARTTYFQSLKTCSTILSYFCDFFLYFSDFQEVTVTNVEHLLTVSVELMYKCIYHCEVSEKVYGPNFSLATDYLTSCFKKCSELIDLFLNFVTNKLTCNLNEDEKKQIIVEILVYLSKSGIALMNLDVKTMGKVWKTYVSLLEKYLCYIKDNIDVSETIKNLTRSITSSVETILLENEDKQELIRTIKLACFNLKLIIKFCELFADSLNNCQKSLLNLLMLLSRCHYFHSNEDKFLKNNSQEILKQLTVGAEPLLSQLVQDTQLIKEFGIIAENLTKSNYDSCVFSSLCCLILKKLICCNYSIRSLWFNENDNILKWIFLSVSSDEYKYCVETDIVENVVVAGKQKKLKNFYEYVLISVSAFLMTSNTTEFNLAEKILIKNVMQTQPLTALLAIDIWCLLARFSDSTLCLSQILNLNKILLEFQNKTVRVEICYLKLLIQRLFPLLTQSQKEFFLKSSYPSHFSELCKSDGKMKKTSSFDVYFMYNLDSKMVKEIEKFSSEEKTQSFFDLESSFFGEETGLNKAFEERIVKFWKFNSAVLNLSFQKDKFLKSACLLCENHLQSLSSKNIYMILNKIRKLLQWKQSTAVGLYFTKILHILSTYTIPSDQFQRPIIEAMADIFNILLLSDNIFLKQRAVETFYRFSHVTKHTEIITLSVKNSQTLKLYITNYFQKNLTEHFDFDINKKVCELCKSSFQHKCINSLGVKQFENHGNQCLVTNKISSSHENIREISNRWLKDSEDIIQCIEQLTPLQKNEIKNICNLIMKAVNTK